MLNFLKISAFLLLLTAFGFIYRVTYKQDCISCISFIFQESRLSTPSSPKNNPRLSNLANYKDILSQGNGIIFLETSDRLDPPPLVLCAIESAARVYPDRPVAFFMKGLANITAEDFENRTQHFSAILLSFNNVYIFPLVLEDIFKDTPLLSWYLKVNPKLETHWIHVSSDGCRLALIWKYGGIYMDTDIISIRPIPAKNFLAAQSSKYSSNGIFGLTPGQNFSWISMENFVQNYNGEIWGNQGPGLFTRVLNTFCSLPEFKHLEDISCANISFLNPQRFYPISYPSWRLYYEVWKQLPKFNDSYGLHLWNYMNHNTKTIVPGSNTLVEHLYQQHCPTIYRALIMNESIYN